MIDNHKQHVTRSIIRPSSFAYKKMGERELQKIQLHFTQDDSTVSRQKINLSSEQVMCVGNFRTLFSACIIALTDEGDAILSLAPHSEEHFIPAIGLHRSVSFLVGRTQQGLLSSSLEELRRRLDRCKLVVVANPLSEPADENFLEAVISLCRTTNRNTIIVVDERFAQDCPSFSSAFHFSGPHANLIVYRQLSSTLHDSAWILPKGFAIFTDCKTASKVASCLSGGLKELTSSTHLIQLGDLFSRYSSANSMLMKDRVLKNWKILLNWINTQPSQRLRCIKQGCLGFILSQQQAGWRQGHEVGRRQGHEVGRRQGHEVGRRQGHEVGRRQGHQAKQLNVMNGSFQNYLPSHLKYLKIDLRMPEAELPEMLKSAGAYLHETRGEGKPRL